MDWKEVSPGRYERPAGSHELYMQSLLEPGRPLGRGHWEYYSCCSIEVQNNVEDIIEHMKRAWTALRHDLPGIAAQLNDGVWHYTSPDSAALEDWVRETFSVHPEVSSSDELLATLRPVPLPMLKYLPQSSQLILHGPHCSMDGMGSLRIWDKFFQHLVADKQPKFGEEGKSLTPCLEVAIGSPDQYGPEVEAFLEEDVSNVLSNGPYAGLAYNGDGNTIPGDTGRYSFELYELSTTNVIKTCKQHGISVTAALSATLSKVIYALGTSDVKDLNVMQMIPLDVRPYLEGDHKYAADVCYTSALFGVVKPQQSWIESANTFMKAIKKHKSGDIMLQSRLIFVEKFKILFHSPEGAPPPCDFTMSSFGDITRFLGKTYGTSENLNVVVKDFYAQVDVLTRHICTFVWTFRGKLRISFNYNVAYYDRSFLEKVTEAVKDVLGKEFQIANNSDDQDRS